MPYSHTMRALPSAYDSLITEKKWQQHWHAARTYAWDSTAAREDNFVIDTPPPTVSGELHMGHVFSYTQADFIARFQRMQGKNVFYPMGFDDNGLPTERLVEKTKKIRATDMSREAFIAECLSVSESARAEFRALFQSIALSVDWDQEYHTISDDCRRLSQMSFLDMVQKNEVYRKLQPMLWDPVDQTAIAQAEVVDKELPSNFCDIAFTCEETGAELIIGTTRPELLPACVALFYHPEDARYQSLKDKHARVPLFGFSVPIYTDEAVEMDKGTGLMMCCTFGDEKDIEKWRTHNLPTRMVLNKYGKMDLESLRHREAEGRGDLETGLLRYARNDALLEKLQGKKASNADAKHPGAREIIIAELETAGLMRAKKPIVHAVKTAERSGAVLELIPTHQWFVKVLDKKEALKEKAKQCNWNPEWMRVRIEQWIDGLNWDWCISRQRYFGVPFPVWHVRKYGSNDSFTTVYPQRKQNLPVNPIVDLPKGMIKIQGLSFEMVGSIGAFASEDILDENGKVIFPANSDIQLEVIPDFDVMDTWATSSISPQISAGAIAPHPTPLPEGEGTSVARGEGENSRAARSEGDRFNKLFPADLRPQAHEIIRTWAFYTIVKAHIHNQDIPWKNLMISGWCLAEDKTKMSKSKGNVVTPVALIEEKGTDAVRYWAATSRLGQDTAFSPDLLKIGKKLVSKLWNATQFAAIHLEKLDREPSMHAITETLDRWIISRLHQTISSATEAFARFEYADALDATNQFFWADFCDNYLELIKKRVYNEDGSFTATQAQSAVHALYFCLQGILKLYAPITPHVTEELYSHIFADDYARAGSLHANGMWPNAKDYRTDEAALSVGTQALAVLEEIRKAKSDAKVSIKYPVALVKLQWPSALDAYAISAIEDIKAAGNVQKISTESAGELKVEITLAPEADAA